MGPETLTEVDPAEVRAAVMTESLFMEHPDMEEVRLNFAMTLSDDTSHEFTFHMDDVRHGYIDRLAQPEPGMSWRVYRIRRDELEDFQSMQLALSQWLSSEDVEPRELKISVRFIRVEESENFLDGIHRMVDEVMDAESDQQQVQAAVAEWERDGLRVRFDLQLFEDRGFTQLMRTTRIPIELPEDAT